MFKASSFNLLALDLWCPSEIERFLSEKFSAGHNV